MQDLPELVRWRARVTPELSAIWFEGRELTYRALHLQSNRVANALLQYGIQPGDRICVLDQNHDMFFETIFGIAKAGAVFVPVNWRLAPPEIEYVVNDAEAKLLFVGGAFSEAVESVQGGLSSVNRIISYSEDRPGWDRFDTMRDAASDSDPQIRIDPSRTTWQLYTSGTTGHPKGAELTTSNLFSTYTFGPTLFGGMREGDSSLIAMPLYHIGGSGYALVSLIAGARLAVKREFHPVKALEIIQEEKVHYSFLVPAALLFMLQADPEGQFDLSSCKAVAYGASPIPEDLLRRSMERFGCEFFQVYGLTETSGAVSRLRFSDHHLSGPKTKLLRSCGQPLFGIDVRIADSEGRELPRSEIGEIAVRGPQIMKGYWHNPEATRQSIREGWFYTGDAGYMDEDGFIYIHDRVKDMIVSGGENVYPAEVESCLFEHPAVADVAVIGVPDDKWGEAVKAIVVLKPDVAATEEELIDFCREKIAGYKRPKSVDFVEVLPRNPTGKVLKRALREPYWEGKDRGVS